MKKISYTALFLFTALLCGCTENDSIDKLPTQPLSSVTVTTGGFSSDGGMGTRTTDVKYTTTFVKDDQIGIFAITDDGVILDNNVPYKYDGTTWAPADADNTIHNYNYGGVTYFAYYPYAEAMNGAKSEDEIAGKFTITNNQSTQDSYTASDLMTGAGTVTDAGTDAPKMTLALKHKMSLFVIDIKNIAYVTNDGYEYSEPTGNLAISVTAGGNDITSLLYHPSTAVYRYIVTPGTAISVNVSYIAGEGGTAYSYTGSINSTAAGKYHLINIQRGETTQRNLQVGDFYYQDGSILPKDSEFYQFDSNPCIGIMYRIGTGSEDNLSYYEGKIPAIHGYVLSLHEASKTWGDGSKVWGKGGSGGAHYGFASTQMIMKGIAEGKSFPACSYCVEYTPAPTGVSSGWYLPTTGQLRTFVINPGTINAQLNKIPGATAISGGYLSSSECSTSQIWGVSSGGSSYIYYSKGGSYKTRPFLTF